MPNLVEKISRVLALPLVILLFIYQKTLSFDHGPLRIFFPYGYCRYFPTCSSYAKTILLKEGILGLPRVVKRVLSCNPSSLGGIDMPYKNHNQQ
jgi:putative membrane protein insertion efficiency factor